MWSDTGLWVIGYGFWVKGYGKRVKFRPEIITRASAGGVSCQMSGEPNKSLNYSVFKSVAILSFGKCFAEETS